MSIVLIIRQSLRAHFSVAVSMIWVRLPEEIRSLTRLISSASLWNKSEVKS